MWNVLENTRDLQNLEGWNIIPNTSHSSAEIAILCEARHAQACRNSILYARDRWHDISQEQSLDRISQCYPFQNAQCFDMCHYLLTSLDTCSVDGLKYVLLRFIVPVTIGCNSRVAPIYIAASSGADQLGRGQVQLFLRPSLWQRVT
jgi:hypothetical protein